MTTLGRLRYQTAQSLSDLQTDVALKANIDSPTFTGTVGGITAAMVGAPSGSGTSSGTNTGDQIISDATISTTDITTNNATTAKHGFLKKLSNTSTEFMNGVGDWATPAGGVTPKRVVGMTFDGGGSPPTVGSVGYVVCPFNGTIDQWAIVADASGSGVIDVWKAAGAIPINANTIAGSEKPTLSAQQLNTDTSLSTWTTTVTAGDVFGFELESVATCTRLTVEVRISESA